MGHNGNGEENLFNSLGKVLDESNSDILTKIRFTDGRALGPSKTSNKVISEGERVMIN